MCGGAGRAQGGRDLISAPLAWLKKPHGGLRNLVSPGVAARREESTREAAAMRGAACCASRSGLARVFASRALARGASKGLASVDARAHAWRAGVGVPCAWECAVRMKMGHVGRVAVHVRAVRVPRPSERADPGNARVARSVVRARRRGAVPVELAMGSWERSHWGLLPPWETFLSFFLGSS